MPMGRKGSGARYTNGQVASSSTPSKHTQENVMRKLKEEGYMELVFSWESVTASGYEVERVATAAATVRRGTLYAACSPPAPQPVRAPRCWRLRASRATHLSDLCCSWRSSRAW